MDRLAPCLVVQRPSQELKQKTMQVRSQCARDRLAVEASRPCASLETRCVAEFARAVEEMARFLL